MRAAAARLRFVDEAGSVDVYAHGGTSPIRKLTTSGAPYGCAIDPTTGDLALTNLSSYLYGTIAIYPKAMGRPKAYKDDNVDSTFFCGYDNAGNLFADGWNRSAKPILLELAKKGKSLGMFDLDPSDKNPGGVRWDGKYVAVGNRGGGVIYRIGSTGKTAQTITLKDGLNVEQFWLDGSTLIGPNFQGDGPVAYWNYPPADPQPGRSRDSRSRSERRSAQQKARANDDNVGIVHATGGSTYERSSALTSRHPSNRSVRTMPLRRISIALPTPGPPAAPNPYA